MPKLDDQEIKYDGQGDHDKNCAGKCMCYKSLKRLSLVIGTSGGENALKSDAFE